MTIFKEGKAMSLSGIKETSTQNLYISHSINDNWEMVNYHFHNNFEILLSLNDKAKIFIDNNVYEMHRGDLFLINNMELHRTVASKNKAYERYVIMFSPEYIQPFCTDKTNLLHFFTHRKAGFSNKLNLSESKLTLLISLLEKIKHYESSNTYGSDIYIQLTFIEVLLFINTAFTNIGEDPNKSSSKDFEKINPILEYINKNLSEDLSLELLSKKFFLSKYHLCRSFKSSTGFTLNEYIINKRILKARELLKQGINVMEVCEEVGFNNYCHFIRTFKKLVGVSPKKYSKL